ncbi:MAG: hypothetical protein AVO35_08665 [Candidatus Aegiribacteria sp. MLS_C]|nr:MAG: hypothetical protein AVO35_08665 [Candidatus Aegiribacteria sp. MLS_C]
MMTAVLVFLSVLSIDPADAFTLRLGPFSRFLFPSIGDRPIVNDIQDLDNIFLPSEPEVMVGASVMLEFIPSFQLEISGSYVGYEFDPLFGDPFPDSTWIIERSVDLAVVSVGLRKCLGEVYVQAGSDILFYNGSWVRTDGTGWGGYHDEYKGTTWGPFLGIGKDLHTGIAEFDIALRLHLPDLSDRWISAGLSVFFH